MEGFRPAFDAAPSSPFLTEIAIGILKLRRARERSYPNLFNDPSWDILIDLYASAGRNRLVSITSACLASVAPTSTALRHIDRLIAQNLIQRIEDARDRRRIYLTLTGRGLRLTEEFMLGLSNLIHNPSTSHNSTYD